MNEAMFGPPPETWIGEAIQCATTTMALDPVHNVIIVGSHAEDGTLITYSCFDAERARGLVRDLHKLIRQLRRVEDKPQGTA
jgi:hypothetical protein